MTSNARSINFRCQEWRFASRFIVPVEACRWDSCIFFILVTISSLSRIGITVDVPDSFGASPMVYKVLGRMMWSLLLYTLNVLCAHSGFIFGGSLWPLDKNSKMHWKSTLFSCCGSLIISYLPSTSWLTISTTVSSSTLFPPRLLKMLWGQRDNPPKHSLYLFCP